MKNSLIGRGFSENFHPEIDVRDNPRPNFPPQGIFKPHTATFS
jgi:hypothetical protein